MENLNTRLTYSFITVERIPDDEIISINSSAVKQEARKTMTTKYILIPKTELFGLIPQPLTLLLDKYISSFSKPFK